MIDATHGRRLDPQADRTTPRTLPARAINAHGSDALPGAYPATDVPGGSAAAATGHGHTPANMVPRFIAACITVHIAPNIAPDIILWSARTCGAMLVLSLCLAQ